MNIFYSIREGRIFILLFFFFTFAALPGICTLSASSTGGYHCASHGNCCVSAALFSETGSARVILKPNQTPYSFPTLNPAPAAILFTDCCYAASSATNTTFNKYTAATVANTDITSIFVLFADKTDYGKVEWQKICMSAAAEETVNRINSCCENIDTCLQAKTENRVNELYVLCLPVQSSTPNLFTNEKL